LSFPGLVNRLIAVDISTLKKRIKKLRTERKELENTFREIQQRKQDKLLAKAEELDRGNKDLRAKIEAMELNTDDDEEID
jgi:vacuolar-type H+-ATPase subunit I/STV1